LASSADDRAKATARRVKKMVADAVGDLADKNPGIVIKAA
jgi:hypothetical protein